MTRSTRRSRPPSAAAVFRLNSRPQSSPRYRCADGRDCAHRGCPWQRCAGKNNRHVCRTSAPPPSALPTSRSACASEGPTGRCAMRSMPLCGKSARPAAVMQKLMKPKTALRSLAEVRTWSARRLASCGRCMRLPSSPEPFDLALQDSEKFAAAAAALAASLAALGEEAQTAREPEGTSPRLRPTHRTIIKRSRHRKRMRLRNSARTGTSKGPTSCFISRNVEQMTVRPDSAGQPRPPLPGPQLLPSPQEDPAELFEPVAGAVAVLPASAAATSAAKPAPTPLASAVSAAAQAVRAANNPPTRSPTGPTVRPMPRPAPVSPLAALRALTEEELIALFG